MMTFLRISLLALLVGLCGFKSAEQTVNPFVKGSFTAIQQQHQKTPHLIVFWSQDCAYCMKELEMLGSVLKKHPDLVLVTVATDPFLDEQFIQSKMASFGLRDVEKWVFASDYPETLYFDVDKRWRGELPLTYLIDHDNNKIKKSGMLKHEQLQAWLSTISQTD